MRWRTVNAWWKETGNGGEWVDKWGRRPTMIVGISMKTLLERPMRASPVTCFLTPHKIHCNFFFIFSLLASKHSVDFFLPIVNIPVVASVGRQLYAAITSSLRMHWLDTNDVTEIS